jgi:4'-phosphopantetheinyl transferase
VLVAVTGIAVTTGTAPVGVDIECITDIDYLPLLDKVCSPTEAHHVCTAVDFFTYWTRKESVVKATGVGLMMPMRSVEVTPPLSAPALLVYGDGSLPAARMRDLDVVPGYAAAVTVLCDEPVVFTAPDTSDLLAAI